MRKNENKVTIEGRVYQHDLSVKKVKNEQSENFGKDFISGNLEVATDEECMNIVKVHYTYVAPTTKSGGTNRTFSNLKKIIEANKSVLTVGKDEAIKVKLDSAIALNDFYVQDDTLVSAKRAEGGFVTIVSTLNEDEKKRNTFKADMVITNITLNEANPEKNIKEDYLSVRGAVFSYKNVLLPVDFIVRAKDGIEYFEKLDISNANPFYVSVWGRINSRKESYEKVEESPFGEPCVTTYEREVKEWIITGGLFNKPYEFDDESTITREELTKAMQDREVYLAGIKKSAEEYRMKQAAEAATPSGGFDGFSMPAPAVNGEFNF